MKKDLLKKLLRGHSQRILASLMLIVILMLPANFYNGENTKLVKKSLRNEVLSNKTQAKTSPASVSNNSTETSQTGNTPEYQNYSYPTTNSNPGNSNIGGTPANISGEPSSSTSTGTTPSRPDMSGDQMSPCPDPSDHQRRPCFIEEEPTPSPSPCNNYQEKPWGIIIQVAVVAGIVVLGVLL